MASIWKSKGALLTYLRNCAVLSGILKDLGMNGKSTPVTRLTLLVRKPEPGKWFTWRKKKNYLYNIISWKSASLVGAASN
jgi:hypothetical protein